MKLDTLLKTTLESSDEKAMYDALCKQVLSNKMILAWIMKECVIEYRDIEVEEIAYKYIEGEPEVGTTNVIIGEQIRGLPTESVGINEGKIFYDIRYRAIAPSNEGNIELIINVEAQNQYNPGYPLIKRGIYYASRMISGQYGIDFVHGDYDRIKKVYSIWICRNVPKNRENTITSYDIKETNIIGNVVEKTAHYDLMSVVMVYLGQAVDEQQSQTLRMLNTLLSESIRASEKLAVLSDEFRIPKAKQLESGVQYMCNLSQGIEDIGFEKGMQQGMQQWKIQTAKNFLEMGLSTEQVAQGTGLAVGAVEALRDELTN